MPINATINSMKQVADQLRVAADAIEQGHWGKVASLQLMAHLVNVPLMPEIGPAGPQGLEHIGATLILSTLENPKPLIARDWLARQVNRSIDPRRPSGDDLFGEFIFGTRAP